MRPHILLLIAVVALTGLPAVPAGAHQLEATTVAALGLKPYGGRIVAIGEQVSADTFQHTYRVTYVSEGLKINGLLGLPVVQSATATGELRPWPGIVLAHGYYDPKTYFSGQGTQSTVEGLAGEGYVVLMPDYRGYGGSEGGMEAFVPGGEYDVINAVEALRALPFVDDDRIGLIGYSWGGGFAAKAAEALGDKLACLVNYYGQLGGLGLSQRDIQLYSAAGVQTMDAAERLFRERSPIPNANMIKCPVLLIHGAADRVVQLEQSQAFAQQLRAAGRSVELVVFPQEGHAFGDNYDNPGREKMLVFLRRQLQDRPWSGKWRAKWGRVRQF